MTGLNILALVLATLMSWHYLTGGSMSGCGVGSPCEQVLNSRWSTIAGVLPVSGLGGWGLFSNAGFRLSYWFIFRDIVNSPGLECDVGTGRLNCR